MSNMSESTEDPVSKVNKEKKKEIILPLFSL